MLRRLAKEGLSGRKASWKINTAFGTFFSADAVTRQAYKHGIKLQGKAGAPWGNTNGKPETQTRDPLGRFV
jgi:hypothetical protein